jgi:hypothetical protein
VAYFEVPLALVAFDLCGLFNDAVSTVNVIQMREMLRVVNWK